MSDNKKIIVDEAPIPDTEPAREKPRSSKKKKIVIISVFAGLLLLGVISWIILYALPEKNVNPMFSQEKQEEIVGMYGSTQSYIYYPIDYDLDIMTEKEYLDLDRCIYYTEGAETFSLNEYPLEELDADMQFFFKYFDLAISGNYDEYNKLFTENYYKSNEPYYSFTQQMIYDIRIERLGEDVIDGDDVFYYNVSYKIHRNNGTFRNDIGSDGSKTLCFTLVDRNGTVLVDSINYYLFN
ncbi:MAG: hypothetical protein E7647_00590 [Ruminococcaceae bacterium]|nr:hypothetical protein [Oscillospiraceae bacterium]